VLKLWNTYAFFCNYARLDGFDPNQPQVPVKDRPDIDRWILSDLQILIQTARREFERFNVQAFCLKAEEFVDDKLSNWYVRRNRRRFWKSEQSADKRAAYQTLYTVLTTLTKLFAPIMPFLTESIYRNLTLSGGREPPESSSFPESVHHCAFPEADRSLIDDDLSADMEALLRIVSLGSAARNIAKIKVRQPLAQIKVVPDSEADKAAIARFSDQICEELNIKAVALADEKSLPFSVEAYLKPDQVKWTFGAKAGQVIAALNKLSRELKGELANRTDPFTLTLTSGDSETLQDPREYFDLRRRGLDGWEVVNHFGTIVGVDTRLTDALKKEGLAREVVRHVQNARKEAGLEMEDRIVLYLHTESKELREAIEAHKEYICRETLAVKWATQPLGEGAYRTTVKVDGQQLIIELRKIS
jgi:isoleucyl-tRNA synthetase